MKVLVVALAVAALCAAPLVLAGEGPSAPAKPDFKKMDKDGDGKVTVAEFAGYIEAYPELGLAKAVFEEMDVNKDGVVTLSEFEAWVPISPKGSEAPEVPAAPEGAEAPKM